MTVYNAKILPVTLPPIENGFLTIREEKSPRSAK